MFHKIINEILMKSLILFLTEYVWYTICNRTYIMVTYHMDYSLEMKRIEHMRILKKREELISSSSLCFWGTLVIIMSSYFTFFGHLYKNPTPKKGILYFTSSRHSQNQWYQIFFEYPTNIKTFYEAEQLYKITQHSTASKMASLSLSLSLHL